MRHVSAAGLDELEPLLASVRRIDGLTEVRRGVFHRRSRAFLHFHEDPAGLYADVRLRDDFERFRVQTEREQDALMDAIVSALG